jgi:hypothetical protein
VAVDSTRFLARWPHFEEAPDATVDEAIASAKLRVNPRYFGDRADEAVMQLAAHTIAQDPGGQFARLIAKDGSTTYGKAFDRLCGEVQVGDRLI